MTIKIEDGIPLPDDVNAHGRPEQFPFSILEIGQSFWIEGLTSRRLSHVQYARKKYPDRSFITRTVEGGVRVWRTK